MSYDLVAEIRERLIADFHFKTSSDGKYLRQGVCPNCGKKELWASAEKPLRVHCPRGRNCGHEANVKELYPELFGNWSERYQKPEEAKPPEQRNPTAAADAYLRIERGFSLALVKGLYTQEYYYDPRADKGRGAGTATVRFALGETWWERLIDQPERFEKKANFKTGGSYAGLWWTMPTVSFDAPHPSRPDAPKPPAELWLVEGIFDAIALAHHGVAAASLMSCYNYPGKALAALDELLRRQGGTVPRPTLVWALDNDEKARERMIKYVLRAREAGWTCQAAQIAQGRAGKLDWNDMHLADRLEPQHLKVYRYHGALLLAQSAREKALLMHEHGGRSEFDLEFGHQLWWFELKEAAYNKARDDIRKQVEDGKLGQEEADKQLAEARRSCSGVRRIANCVPRCRYYQRDEITDDAWYYFRVERPNDRKARNAAFKAGELTSAPEFERRLLHTVPGAMWSGTPAQLKYILARELDDPKEVQTINFIGYSAEHQAYILGPVAVRAGKVALLNEDDYFDFGDLWVKTLHKSIQLQINTEPTDTSDWQQALWTAYGAQGLVALSFWLGSLFAEQIRAAQQSLFFLEMSGEPGGGKTTLLNFFWRLLGRAKYEGVNIHKSSGPGWMRKFAQMGNLPTVLIESDTGQSEGGKKTHARGFDWDELKDSYDGNPIRTIGMKTSGNETYEPPFRSSIVIAQNAPVQGSPAIMERICSMTFDIKRLTDEGRVAGNLLSTIKVKQVSGFILAALMREEKIVRHIAGAVDGHMRYLLSLDGVTKQRIAKNHAQLLAMAEAAGKLLRWPQEWQDAARAQVEQMARERQAAISADPPVVAEFREAFDYLDAMGAYDQQMGRHVDKPLLNHSCNPDDYIAVNLNQFIQLASERRQQVPLLGLLKRELLGVPAARGTGEMKGDVMTAQPTDDELRAALARLRALPCCALWPDDLAAALADPIRARLLRIDAARVNHARTRARQAGGARTWTPRGPVPAAGAAPIFDRKRAAAGEREE
jgi:hypothetical protein